MIPYMLYLEVMRRYSNPKGDNIAGVDVNVERLDAVVIDRHGNLLSYKTFWLKNATFMGVRKNGHGA